MVETVLFVILDGFADWEYAYVASAVNTLGVGKFRTATISLTKDVITSIGGLHVIPDHDLDDVPEYDALILIGATTWRVDASREISVLVKDCLDSGKILGGICDASVFLGACGVLNDVCHTSNELKDLKAWAGDAYTGEGNYREEQAVRGGNIITANGTAALEFAREVLSALGVASENDVKGWFDFHKMGFYDFMKDRGL